MRRSVVLAACVLALCAPAASAQTPYVGFDGTPGEAATDEVAGQAAWRAWAQRSATALAATGQPRELAFAAVLDGLSDAALQMPQTDAPSQPVTADTQAATWRQAAAPRVGGDPLANTLLAYGADEATRLRAAQRWLAGDPRNLAPLLMRDGSADALLADARAATRFDLGMLEQVRWMQAALLRTPPTAGERVALADAGEFVAAEYAAIQAMGLWSATAIPGLQPLLEGCDASATQGDPARTRDCRHVAGVMANGSDTLLGQLIGIGLLDRLAATPDERADARARRRTLDWQNLEWGRASAALPRDGAGQLVRLLGDETIGSEPELVERALQDAGVALEPPAGWRAPTH